MPTATSLLPLHSPTTIDSSITFSRLVQRMHRPAPAFSEQDGHGLHASRHSIEPPTNEKSEGIRNGLVGKLMATDAKGGQPRVHLGCGFITPAGWINVDGSWNAR